MNTITLIMFFTLFDQVFAINKESRMHTIINVRDNRWMMMEVILPVVQGYCFVQFWTSNWEGKTSEIGVKKSTKGLTYRTFGFNTDDRYCSGWFDDGLTIWSQPWSSKCRVGNMKAIHFYPGEKIRMVATISNNKLEMWINKEYVGSVNIDHEIRTTDMGIETHDTLIGKNHIKKYDYYGDLDEIKYVRSYQD
jgi:hypothetical protein